jgi:signal transduction histidine kinase
MSGYPVDVTPRRRLADASLAVVIGALVVTVAAFDADTTAVDYALDRPRLGGPGRSTRRLRERSSPWPRRRRRPMSCTPIRGRSPVCPSSPPCTRRPGGHRALGGGAGAVFLGRTSRRGRRPSRCERTALIAGWFLCAVVTGLADRNWQAYLRQTEQRALEAERTREEAALRRAGEERLRIARELHDSLTHSISIVKLQAGVAVHLAASAARRCRPRCSPSRRRAARRCANCGPPWRSCAPPRSPPAPPPCSSSGPARRASPSNSR